MVIWTQAKSASYDHIVRRENGGLGDTENGQITHPYCNQSIKINLAAHSLTLLQCHSSHSSACV